MIEKSGDIIVKKMYAQTENIKQSTAPLEKPLYVRMLIIRLTTTSTDVIATNRYRLLSRLPFK